MRFPSVVTSRRKHILKVFDAPVIGTKEPYIISLYRTQSDADDNHTMSARNPAPPASKSSQSRSSYTHSNYRAKRPTLAEILADTSTSPWTLRAFTAYAAQNLCQENIDFTIEAKQYEKLWQEVLEQSPDSVESPDSAKKEKLKQAWKRLMRVYMTANGPREINLPGDVRSALLSIPDSSLPPSPETLKPALRKIYELMEESIFFPFLAEMQTSSAQYSSELPEKSSPSHPHSATSAQLQLQQSTSHGSGAIESSFPSRSRPTPQAHNSLPIPHLGRPVSTQTSKSGHKSSNSGGHNMPVIGGGGGLTEEPNAMSSVPHEGSTKSTTPPASEAGGRKLRQRSPSENPWRKIGSKLGFTKRRESGVKEQSERLALERGRSPGPVFEEG